MRGQGGMTETLRRVQALVLSGDVRVSEHGYEELGKDAIPRLSENPKTPLPNGSIRILPNG